MRFSTAVGSLLPLLLNVGCRTDVSRSGTRPSPVSTLAPGDGSAGDSRTVVSATWCGGPHEVFYDPPANRETLPDDVFTVDDPDTVTGLRVSFAQAEDEITYGWRPHYDDLETLDGFGVTGPFVVRLSAAPDPDSLPPIGQSVAHPRDAVLLVRLPDDSMEPARLLPFDWEIIAERPGDPSANLALLPRLPLEPNAKHALMVTERLRDGSGACFAPSTTMRSLLEETVVHPALLRVLPRLARAREVFQGVGSIAGPEEIALLTVFTTQHILEDDRRVRRIIRDEPPASWVRAPRCDAPEATHDRCEALARVADFRRDGRFVDEQDLRIHAFHDVPVSFFLPPAGQAVRATLLYGHGLAGSRNEAVFLAERLGPRGWAVVAMDALMHGDHPVQPSILLTPLPVEVARVYAFFGLSVTLDPDGIFDPLAQRDNWRQSNYERLQLLELLSAGVDVDGNGEIDVDTGRLAYLGVSMGGIMGAELSFLWQELDSVVVVVPGARVSSIINGGLIFDTAMAGLRRLGTEGQLARMFGVWQALIDRGDPAVYARQVLHASDGTVGGPQTLMLMVEHDEIIPTPSNVSYGRALGAPVVGRQLVAVGVPHQPGLPTRENVARELTAGLFQYDVVTKADGEVAEARHLNIAQSVTALVQIEHFLSSVPDDERGAEIIDPYGFVPRAR